MNTIEFLSHLRLLDIQIWADEDKLKYSAPEGTLTEDLRAELSRRKPDILAFLRQAELATHLEISPIQPVSRDGRLSLSSGQQRLWFLQQLYPKSPAYNFPIAARLTGPLNVGALERSLAEIVRRHESLRTTFDTRDGHLVQIISSSTDYQLPIISCQLDQVEDLSEAMAWQPFDLAQGPLFRTKLLRLDEREHIFLLNFHHIIFDGWSKDIFYRELSTLYGELSNPKVGRSGLLPELPIQYVDFAHWEEKRFQETGQKGLAYWRKQLGGELPTLQLYTDHSRPAVQSFRGATRFFALPELLSERIKRLSREKNISLFVTLLAAFYTLLHRYSGQTDILVGTPSANRNRSEIEDLIGFFVNTLVLRTDLSGNPAFEALLTRVREVALQGQAHEEVPFGKLVEALQPERNLSQQPLFQAMFILQNTPPAELALPGLQVVPLKIKNKTAKFDLSLELYESKQGLAGSFEYNTDLFEAETIDRMVGYFRTLLEGVVADPSQKISDLPLLTEPEWHQLVVEWNDTQADYPYHVCLHHLFEAQVERTPESVAVVFPAPDSDEHQDRQLTYQELNHQANQLAHYLKKLGVGPETLVGICVERSLEMVIGLLGVLKAGGAYVPLDPTDPRERLAFMVRDTQTTVLLTQKRLLANLPVYNGRVICLDTDWQDIAQESSENPVSRVTADNLAYVIYTSGSTGKPKGAMNTHRAVSNRILWMQDAYQLTEVDRILQKTPFSFDVSGWEFHWPLQTGACLVMAQPEGHKDSAYLIEVINQQQITTIHFVPSMLQILLEDPNVGSCRTLRRVICSGEALPYDLQERFFDRLDTELHNLYGPTEAAIDVTYWRCQPKGDRRVVPIGRPISNVQIYLLDSYLNPVPIGVPGELHIGGIGVARGYLNRPELTKEKFIPNPFSSDPSTRLYKTGDLACYLPDGNIEYLGRLDHQVKIRGFRVELGEIEASLSQHPNIREAVVLAREDTPGNKHLVAYMIFKDQLPDYVGILRSYLAEKLPDYMIPASFVPLQAFPLTSSGKGDRRALPAPNLARPDLSASYVAPRNPLEAFVANIWAEVLGLQRVGIYDDFFELGGHSLQVAQISFQIRQKYLIDLPLSDFFRTATVADLAQTIQVRQDQSAETIETAFATDFEAEAALDPAIKPKAPFELLAQPASIFLTGGTGYVGGFVLRELLQQTEAKVFCLVRAASTEAGYRRIKDNLESCLLWDEKFKHRIIPIIGDLSQPYFGLSKRQFDEVANNIDVIYHCGALVNLVYPYQKLKPANVLGTQEVLRLATRVKTIPVHYISTFGVFNSLNNFDGRVIYEDDELTASEGLVNGYSQSKWVAEKLMTIARSRGIPVSIYRSRLLVGDSRTGFWKAEDYFLRYIQGWIQLGSMPDLDIAWYMLPVNHGVQAIVYLSKQTGSLGKVFHVTTSGSLSARALAAFIQAFGYPLRLIPYAEWHTELIRLTKREPRHALYPLLPHFVQPVSAKETTTIGDMYTLDKEPQYDRRHLIEGLAGSGIVFPVIDYELLTTYFSYFIGNGLLPAPLVKTSFQSSNGLGAEIQQKIGQNL